VHIETTGTGPDLVMIHGWAMHAGIFAPLTRLLAPRFRLHLVDLPGHGFSRDDPGSLDPVECARGIAAAIPRAIWLGWSLGGLVAMRAALDLPAQVRALVPIASSPRFVIGDDWPFGIAPSVLAEFGAGLARDYRATIERFLALEAMGSDHARAELRELRTHAFERGEPGVSALESGMRVLENADLRDEIARLATPSLWIAGRRDRLVDSGAMQWSAERCSGRFVACDSGHAPFLAHAAALADALAAWAAELPA
jgi:pimeloyl-[acyl-carrier protein] methyl ester esterase